MFSLATGVDHDIPANLCSQTIICFDMIEMSGQTIMNKSENFFSKINALP